MFYLPLVSKDNYLTQGLFACKIGEIGDLPSVLAQKALRAALCASLQAEDW